jgi:hypothetical protein
MLGFLVVIPLKITSFAPLGVPGSQWPPSVDPLWHWPVVFGDPQKGDITQPFVVKIKQYKTTSNELWKLAWLGWFHHPTTGNPSYFVTQFLSKMTLASNHQTGCTFMEPKTLATRSPIWPSTCPRVPWPWLGTASHPTPAPAPGRTGCLWRIGDCDTVGIYHWHILLGYSITICWDILFGIMTYELIWYILTYIIYNYI